MARLVDVSNLQQFTAVNLLSDPGAIAGPKLIPQCSIIGLAWTQEDGKIAHNILYGRYTGTFNGSQSQATSIFNALSTGAAWTAMAAFMASSTGLANVYLRDVNSADRPIIYGTGATVPGTSASPALPNEVAACVSLTTARTGPQNRGRFYIPGFATNALGAGNVIAGGAVTAINNWANTITGALIAQGYVWVIGQPARNGYTSPVTGRVFPPRAATSIDVSGHVLKDNHWDTQRRRGLK